MTIRDLPTTLDEALRRLNGRDQVTIANNTVLGRVDNIGVDLYLHGHRIVTFSNDGSILLRDAGWFTTTTKQRLNVVARAHGVNIFSDRRVPKVTHITHLPDGTPVHWTSDWQGSYVIPAPQ